MATHLPKKVQTLTNVKTHTLTLQRKPQGSDVWHDVRDYGPEVSIEQALKNIEIQRATNKAFGTCRLVEYVEVHTKTMEVL